jgi:hypothetical protein
MKTAAVSLRGGRDAFEACLAVVTEALMRRELPRKQKVESEASVP